MLLRCSSLRAGRAAAWWVFPLAIGWPVVAPAAESVSVTGTRVPVRVGDAIAEVTVIDRAALDKAEGRTLSELLSQQAGLQLSSNGGLGKTASIFIRGLEARHTLLLVDGVPVNSATVGSPSLDNLPLELIDRIEIVRGPMTSLYGNGAMGGVVQLFTRTAPAGAGAQAKLVAGSHRHGQAAAGASYGSGAFDVIVSAQRLTVDSPSATNPRVPFGSHDPDRDGFQQTGASLKLGWQAAPGWRIEWLSLASDGQTRIDDGLGADARAELRNRVHLLSGRGTVVPGWTTRLAVSESTDAYETLASASPFTDLGTIQTRERRLAWENHVATPIGTALALAERTTQKVGRPQAPFSTSERDIDALALGLSGQAGGHSWQASLRRDRNPQFGGQTTGALGWGWSFAPRWRLLASAGTSHTLPSFNQLYFPGFGNPRLLPEEGRHGEVALQWTVAEGQRLRAAYYEHRYRGFITSGPQPANLPRAEIEGITLSWQAQWRELSIDASLDHTDPRNATAGNANLDKLLPRRAPRSAKLSADWTPGAWSLGASVRAFSHRFDNAANTVRLGGYGVVDLHADWALSRQWSVGFKLNNVGDQRYETALGYDQPRREGLVSLRYTMR